MRTTLISRKGYKEETEKDELLKWNKDTFHIESMWILLNAASSIHAVTENYKTNCVLTATPPPSPIKVSCFWNWIVFNRYIKHVYNRVIIQVCRCGQCNVFAVYTTALLLLDPPGENQFNYFPLEWLCIHLLQVKISSLLSQLHWLCDSFLFLLLFKTNISFVFTTVKQEINARDMTDVSCLWSNPLALSKVTSW